MEYQKALTALLLSMGLSAGAAQAMEAPSPSTPSHQNLFQLSEVTSTLIAEGEKDKGSMCAHHIFKRGKKDKKAGEHSCGSDKCGSNKGKDEHADDKCGVGMCGSDKDHESN